MELRLRLSRSLALLGAPVLVLGETARRWHQFGDPAAWPSIADDYLIAGALFAAAVVSTRRVGEARTGLAAAWAFAVGMGYPSVFGHLLALDGVDPSGLAPSLIFAIIAIFWLIAIGALLLTLSARGNSLP